MNGSVLVTALVLSFCAQAPATDPKAEPAPVRLPRIPATAYHPKAKDLAYLSRQRWSLKPAQEGKPLPVLMTHLLVTKPDRATYEEASLVYRDGQLTDTAKLKALMDAGAVSFLPANTKVSVLASHREVNSAAFFYPAEIKILEGPGKDLVVWTGFQNLGRELDATVLAEQRKANLKALVEKKKARTAQKNMARAARSARERAAAEKDLANETKLANSQAQAEKAMLNQQYQLMEQQQRIRNLQELNSLNAPIFPVGGFQVPGGAY
jgi:hypothetical protein